MIVILQTPYSLLNLPGQVELFTNSTCVQAFLQKMTKGMDLRLTAVQLIDTHYCTDSTKFISAALLGTTTVLILELPTVGVLSKVDLLTTMVNFRCNLISLQTVRSWRDYFHF